MTDSLGIEAISAGELMSPEGIQGGKNPCYLAAIKLQSRLLVGPEKAQNIKM